jgi:hypothetical protein
LAVASGPGFSPLHDPVEQFGREVTGEPRLQGSERLSVEPVTIDPRELPDEGHDRGIGQAAVTPAELAGNRYPRIKVAQEAEAAVTMRTWV